MREKIIILAIVIIIGFISGYFSSPVSRFISNIELPKPEFGKVLQLLKNQKEKHAAGNFTFGDESVKSVTLKGSITAEAAVNAVKSVPAVKQRVNTSLTRGSQVSFKADQPPTEDYPVWQVELRETYPSQIPDIQFLKVDAYSGQVLDLQKDELQVAGLKLATRLDGSLALGRYEGLQVERDRNKLISRITISGKAWKGPRGLDLGISKTEVVKKLGKANIAQGDILIYISLDDKNSQLHIRLDNENNITEISMVGLVE